MTNLPHDLEAAIIAAPDTADPYLVAADWLQARGDAHGEFIALMRALEHEQSPAQFLAKKQRKEWLQRHHAEEWLDGSAPDALVWRWGFVSHARLEAEHVETFLSSRAGRFMRELEVHGPLDGLVAALAQTRPRVLHGLALVGGRRTPPVELAAVTRTLRLDKLGVVALEVDFTGVSTRELRTLRVRDVQHPTLSAFLGALDADHLEQLELCVDAPLVLKAGLAERAKALTQLHLEDDLADDLARWAASASLVQQLNRLTLCGPMTDVGLDALLRETARLSRLTSLVLEGGHFSGPLRRLAYKQLPAMVFEKSRAEWSFW